MLETETLGIGQNTFWQNVAAIRAWIEGQTMWQISENLPWQKPIVHNMPLPLTAYLKGVGGMAEPLK